MTAADDAWGAGKRALERLAAGQPDTGDAAVDALDDIGTVRRLLDQAELVAVRTARRHGKSWAEIATRLGVTRQSAWERWRDVDAETGASETTSTRSFLVGMSSAGDLDPDVTERLVNDAIERRSRGLRRRSTVVVPNVVGMTWDDARETLARKALYGVSNDREGPPLAALGWPNTVVTDQSPEAGAKVPAGSRIVLWLERGDGSAGVREPRRPRPTPGHGHEWQPEPSDEAVG